MTNQIKPTDYYKAFGPAITKTLEPLYALVKTLTTQIEQIQTNLDEETSSLKALQTEMDQMKETPIDFNESGQMENVNEIKESKRKSFDLKNEIDATRLMIQSLSTLLEKKQTELKNETQVLKNKLRAAMIRCVPIGSESINGLLQAMIDEQNAFTEAFEQIYLEHGLTLKVNEESLIPGVLAINDIEDIRYRLIEYNRLEKLKANSA